MGSFSGIHWLLLLLVVLIVFGAGKLPRVASDLAQGIKNFKKGMAESDDENHRPAAPRDATPRATIDNGTGHNADAGTRDKVSHG